MNVLEWEVVLDYPDNREFFCYPISGYISVGKPDKQVTLLMSFTLFTTLQIFKLTMKLTIQPASVKTDGHSVHVGSATIPQLMRCASYEIRCQSSKC